MLHVCVKDGENDLTHELNVASPDEFISYWKTCADMTSHYQYYKTQGKNGTPFPSTSTSSRTNDSKTATNQVYQEAYSTEDNDAMLNRNDPNFDICVYFHNENACNVWEKKTGKQWKHKGYVAADEESDSEESDKSDDESSESDSESAPTSDSASESNASSSSSGSDNGDDGSESSDSSSSDDDDDKNDHDESKNANNTNTMNHVNSTQTEQKEQQEHEQNSEQNRNSGSKRKPSDDAHTNEEKPSTKKMRSQ